MILMKDPSYWLDEGKLIEYLGGQLLRGRLALLLGAGVSVPFGLPSWECLLTRMSNNVGFGPLPDKADLLRRAQAIKDKHFSNDEDGFLELTHACLYDGVSVEMASLERHPLLSAIGSLVMASRRGSASRVITLNYDDILETYLEYYGFDVTSVCSERHWAPNSDVVIYHPHGFLPLGKARDRSKTIVISTKDYLKAIKNDTDNVWRLIFLDTLRTHTCLHIGLSGDDLNVASLTSSTEDYHAGRPREVAYSGLRFCLESERQKSDDLITTSEATGIHTHFFKDWAELPIFLFRICQEARSLRLAQADHLRN